MQARAARRMLQREGGRALAGWRYRTAKENVYRAKLQRALARWVACTTPSQLSVCP